MRHRIELVKSNEGWAVWCDDLPGCCSQGATREEAIANIRVAIREYLAAQPEIERRFGARMAPEADLRRILADCDRRADANFLLLEALEGERSRSVGAIRSRKRQQDS